MPFTYRNVYGALITVMCLERPKHASLKFTGVSIGGIYF